ncbi:MAG: ClpXP protease specificity-enhancing factor [Betaproteobacteria bacterium]|nr:ClpXP protease specificity-enhancing factor [Betaproteobacteria bacterium]
MSVPSTKPYLIRAIYEWCAEAGLTPYLSVKVDSNTRVPLEYVKNGEIVLNISMSATRNLTISNDFVQFSARFNGASREVSVPVYAISGIFSRENGQGLFFQPEETPAPEQSAVQFHETEPQTTELAVVQPPPAPDALASVQPQSGPQSGKGRLKLVK